MASCSTQSKNGVDKLLDKSDVEDLNLDIDDCCEEDFLLLSDFDEDDLLADEPRVETPQVPGTPMVGEKKRTDRVTKRKSNLGFWSITLQSLLAAVEPESGLSSLETVPSILATLEYVYLDERSMVVRKDGFISTPLHALKQYATKNTTSIHLEVTTIKRLETDKIVIRVEIFTGAFRGIGEAFRKRLATQMAAIDLLLIIKRAINDAHIVPFCIFPGWRVKPEVTRHVSDFCMKNGLKLPQFFTQSNIQFPDRPVYRVQCTIGDQIVGEGESDLPYAARKLAAHQAIELIAGVSYPEDYVAMGDECLTYNDLIFAGLKPIISEAKKQWLLDNSNHEIEPHLRGVDIGEMEAWEKEALQGTNESVTIITL